MYQLLNYYLRWKKKKNILKIIPFIEIFKEKNYDYPDKKHFFNIHINLNEKSTSIFDNLSLKVYIDKVNDSMELFRFWKRKIYINDIDFIIFEFDRTDSINYFNNNVITYWICSYSIMSKEGKKINILNMVSERNDNNEFSEYFGFDTNENYYKYANEILKILSYELDKKCLIINYVKMINSKA